MTTYVLGAGASFHAGYPLCSGLWPRLIAWVIHRHAPDSEYRRAIDLVDALSGPVVDVERLFTDLDLGEGVFRPLSEDQRRDLNGAISRCIADYFGSISQEHSSASLYGEFATKLEKGDVVITFNYDVSLENELIHVHQFGVRNGYGSSLEADWDEPDSNVTVLKLHGSINWIGLLFSGKSGFRRVSDSLGERPFVDNAHSFFPDYPSRILDKKFPGGGVTDKAATLILPTYKKEFSVTTSLGKEWVPFYESLWCQAAVSLERTDQIVIIGYSMPDADFRSRALLLWNSNKRAEVIVCCSSANKSLKAQFRNHGFMRVRDNGGFEDFLGF